MQYENKYGTGNERSRAVLVEVGLSDGNPPPMVSAKLTFPRLVGKKIVRCRYGATRENRATDWGGICVKS